MGSNPIPATKGNEKSFSDAIHFVSVWVWPPEDLTVSTKKCRALCYKIDGHIVAFSVLKNNSRYCMVNGIAVEIELGKEDD